jgi:hypothetical protein
MDNIRNVDELVSEYTTYAIEHGHASETGNSEMANWAHDKLIAVYRVLSHAGENGETAIARLMDFDNNSVRYWAAFHSLKFNEKKAVATLENIANGLGAVAFSADMVLSEWRKGTLQMPQ